MAASRLTLRRRRVTRTQPLLAVFISSHMLFPYCLRQVLDGSPIEVTLAKPVDKDSYVRYTRGTGGRGSMLQGEYTYSLGHVYDPTTTYLGAPVFYAPQAYTAIPSLGTAVCSFSLSFQRDLGRKPAMPWQGFGIILMS